MSNNEYQIFKNMWKHVDNYILYSPNSTLITSGIYIQESGNNFSTRIRVIEDKFMVEWCDDYWKAVTILPQAMIKISDDNARDKILKLVSEHPKSFQK